MAVTSTGTTLTINGYIMTVNPVPAGSLMIFNQTAAPTGWTKQTSHDNKALRVVSGTAGSGGSTAFTSVFASRGTGGSIGSTTLATSQIPSHYHHTLHVQDTSSWGYGGGQGPKWFTATWGWNDWAYTGSKGGGGSHNHSFSGSNIDFAVAYIDIIIASKN